MAELHIKPGSKMRVAFDAPVGSKTEFNMLATFKRAIDEACFFVSAPMLDGHALTLDENQKFLLQYGEGENTFVIAAYPECVEKVGIRTFWKMRKVAEQRVFTKRRDERFKVAMHVSYQRDTVFGNHKADATTIDVSAGGLALYVDDYLEVGEALRVSMLPIQLGSEMHELPAELGIVCWLRPAPKGSLYRNVCGLQFRYADELEREQMKEFVGFVREKYKI